MKLATRVLKPCTAEREYHDYCSRKVKVYCNISGVPFVEPNQERLGFNVPILYSGETRLLAGIR